MSFLRVGPIVGLAATLSVAGAAKAQTDFNQTNLVTDDQANLASLGYSPAFLTDSNLINPWGISHGPGTPFWVSDNNAGVTTLYRVPGAGNTPVQINPGLSSVTIPAADGVPTDMSNPTGQVFNSTSGFKLSNGNPALFLFDTEDGAIAGWNGGTTAQLPVNNSSSGAVYKGLAIDTTDDRLFAANFNSGMVEEYNSSFGLVKSFTDPTLPTGYAPFDVAVIGTKLYVTFALQNGAKHDDVSGPGHGFVDVFDLNGGSMQRLITMGDLNSPWGLQIAPSSFGTLAGDLLVGNFGDGRINAYDATTGTFVSTLDGFNGQPLDITDLWALTVGGGGADGDPNTLYFTAGLQEESHGLFGALTPVPEPSTWAMMGLGFAALGLAGYRRARRARLATTA